MKALLPLTVALLAAPLLAPRALAGTTGGVRDGEVRGVSVRPASGKVEVVIDLQGAAVVQDFTLSNPARLVIDLQGALLTGRVTLYDGQNGGGIRNVRYGQFKPDVVRVVIDLDALKDYQVERAAGQVRVRIGTERTGFAAWSSNAVAPPTAIAAAPRRTAERTASSGAPPAPPVTGGPESAARVTTPSLGRPLSIEEYLATHRADAAQSQAARITVQWDNASIEDVIAGFAAFSGRTIILGKDIKGNVTAEVKNQPWDLALNAVLESQGLGVKYDLGSTTQFFNKLIQRPDPRTAKPVDTNLDGVPDALVPQDNYPSNQNIVSLGGNSLSALGNAAQEVVNPALDLIFSTAIGNFDLTSFVQALQRVDLADIQAEPTITTLDNRQAEILVGDRVPIRIIDVSAVGGGGGAVGTNVPRATVQFQQTGINLRVTPHVTGTRQILMEVHAERSNVRPASVDIGFTFQTQQADNQILVSDGETAVIGGLTVTEVTVSKSGIPFLVDLPILGKLFGFTSQTENRRDLLILITPHIIDDLVAPTGQ